MLIERGGAVGRGVAYADRGFPYLLNVPASRMSANYRGAGRIPGIRAATHSRRGRRGLPAARAVRRVSAGSSCSRRSSVRRPTFVSTYCTARSTNVRRLERHLPLQVELRDGRKLDRGRCRARARQSQACIAARSPQPVADHPAYVADPWSSELQFSRVQKRAC